MYGVAFSKLGHALNSSLLPIPPPLQRPLHPPTRSPSAPPGRPSPSPPSSWRSAATTQNGAVRGENAVPKKKPGAELGPDVGRGVLPGGSTPPPLHSPLALPSTQLSCYFWLRQTPRRRKRCPRGRTQCALTHAARLRPGCTPRSLRAPPSHPPGTSPPHLGIPRGPRGAALGLRAGAQRRTDSGTAYPGRGAVGCPICDPRTPIPGVPSSQHITWHHHRRRVGCSHA